MCEFFLFFHGYLYTCEFSLFKDRYIHMCMHIFFAHWILYMNAHSVWNECSVLAAAVHWGGEDGAARCDESRWYVHSFSEGNGGSIHGNNGSRRAQTHEWRTAAWYFLCWHFFLDHSLHSEVSGLAVWGGNGLEVCVSVNVRHISLHCNTLQFYQHEVAKGWRWVCPSQCTILQHAALHCITLQLISIWWQEVASHRNG